MAVNVLLPLLIPLEENLFNSTRLLSGEPSKGVQFLQMLYCVSVNEDFPTASSIVKVEAVHRAGSRIRYAITEGNEDGRFGMEGRSGVVFLAAPLDHETKTEHNVAIAAEAGGEVGLTSLRIYVSDVNDNQPVFVNAPRTITVIEEEDRELPKVLAKIEARDADSSDAGGLLFTLEGDGVDEEEPHEGTFIIHPSSGELVQIRRLDRDSPTGKAVWKLRIRVVDGHQIDRRTLNEFTNAVEHFERDKSDLKNRNSRKNVDKGPTNTNIARRRRDVSTGSIDVYIGSADVSTSSIDVSIGSADVSTGSIDVSTGSIEVSIGSADVSTGSADVSGSPNEVSTHSKNNNNFEYSNISRNDRNYLATKEGFKVTFKEYFIETEQSLMDRETGGEMVSHQRRKNRHIWSTISAATSGDQIEDFHNDIQDEKVNVYNDIFVNFAERTVKNISRNNVAPLHGGEDPFPVRRRRSLRRSALRDGDHPRSHKKHTRSLTRGSTTSYNPNLFIQNKIFFEPPFSNKENIISKKIRKEADKSSDLSKMPKFRLRRDTGSKIMRRIDNLGENAIFYGKGIFQSTKPNEGGAKSPSSGATLRGPNNNGPLDNVSGGEKCPSVTESSKSKGRNPFHSSETSIQILVKDINDNLPKFSKEIFYAEVKENGPSDRLVVIASAFDADEETLGTNALLTFSLEKNVVHEATGERLFKIDSSTGEIRTSLCCLDREVSSEYRLQVVATDGGGLQGTCTVIVKIADENDNPPKFMKKSWVKSVSEHVQEEEFLGNATLLEVSVSDPDTTNDFAYRIVEESGDGWHLFRISSAGHVGNIFASQILDYENEEHKKGFNFQIQVSDELPRNWSDTLHMDTAWVSITLLDTNDHSPSFKQSERNISLREDVKIGKHVITAEAQDLDSGRNGEITYEIEDPFRAFRIDQNGRITVENELDREGNAGPSGVVRVRAIDRGVPSRSGEMNIHLNILDVNDCSPRLVSSKVLHIRENEKPQKIGHLLFADDDEESLGNGSPFQVKLAHATPIWALQNISVKYNKDLDNGRGGGEVWSLTPLDRETESEIILHVNVSDVTGFSINQKVTIIVDDVNDNRMKPASKTIYVWRPESLASDFSLGRVYVDDLDDWDTGDKYFNWMDGPHPYFLLNEDTGDILATSKIKTGRYDLHLSVSDIFWHQANVSARVTVIIDELPSEVFFNAVSVVVYALSPQKIIRHWSPEGGGVLGKLLEAMEHSMSNYVDKVILVSVEEKTPKAVRLEEEEKLMKKLSCSHSQYQRRYYERFLQPSSKVWVAAIHQGAFVNPIKFRGLLELEIQQIILETSLSVSFEEEEEQVISVAPCFRSILQSPFYRVSPIYETPLVSYDFQMQVVDVNATALVTPFLSARGSCLPSKHPQILFSNFSFNSLPSPSSSLSSPSSVSYDPQRPSFCTAKHCLNGGRCIPTETASRCICPAGTVGPRCKILTRTFEEGGWSWLQHIPSHLPLRISLRFMTRSENGLLLYQGPLSRLRAAGGPPTPMLAIQLNDGKVVLLLEGDHPSVFLTVQRNASLADGRWHAIHVTINRKKVSLMVGFCSEERKNGSSYPPVPNCVVSTSPPFKLTPEPSSSYLRSQTPLQIGGLARPISPKEAIFGWANYPTREGFKGCISELKIGRKFVDLGEPAYSANSDIFCRAESHLLCDSIFTFNEHQTFQSDHNMEGSDPRGQNSSWNECPNEAKECSGFHRCTCKMAATFSQSSCLAAEMPVTLSTGSYANIALSFVPDPLKVTLRLRFKTRSRNGLLVKLSSQQTPLTLSLQISNGYLCLSFSTRSSNRFPQLNPEDDSKKPKVMSSSLSSDFANELLFTDDVTIISSHSSLLCLTKRPISDGVWHTTFAARLGHNYILQVDDAEGWQYNETLPALDDGFHPEPPLEFLVDVREGISVGGVPEFIKRNVSFIYDDLFDACIDDFRISGYRMPLPPSVNNTDQGQVTTMREMQKGCHLDSEVNCTNTHCPPSLVCREVLGQAVCGCKNGSVFTPSGCKQIDLCLFDPCLHGGVCRRSVEGFRCSCLPGFTGQYCDWNSHLIQRPAVSLVLLMAVTLSVAFLVLSVVVICIRLRRSKALKKGNLSVSSLKGVIDTTQSPVIQLKKMRESVLDGGFPQDDLRNYAYEGGGSSVESFESVIASLQKEIGDPADMMKIDSNLCPVVDLLQDLPDADLNNRTAVKYLKQKPSSSRSFRRTSKEVPTPPTTPPFPVDDLPSFPFSSETASTFQQRDSKYLSAARQQVPFSSETASTQYNRGHFD